MTDSEDLQRILAWAFGAPLMALGFWIAWANWYRHIEMAKKRRAGVEQNISGTPFMGSVLFYLGWYIAPLGFTPWILAFLLTEFGNVRIAEADEEPESGPQKPLDPEP